MNTTTLSDKTPNQESNSGRFLFGVENPFNSAKNSLRNLENSGGVLEHYTHYSFGTTCLQHDLQAHGFTVVKGIDKGNSGNYSLPEWLDHSFLGELLNQDLAGTTDRTISPLLAPAQSGNKLVDTELGQPLHCDNAYTKAIPKLVLLICDKPSDSGGISLVAKIENLLSADLLCMMKDIYPEKRVEWVKYIQRGSSIEREFLWREENGYGFAFTPFVSEARFSSELTSLVYKSILKGYSNPRQLTFIKLMKGDILILNNTKTVHGRTSFLGERVLRRQWYSGL